MRPLLPLAMTFLLAQAAPVGAEPALATGQGYDFSEAGACAKAREAAQAAVTAEAARRKLPFLQVTSTGECRCVAPAMGGEEFGVAVAQWQCTVEIHYAAP